ncbi:MAG: hypothetical protein M0R66_07320 [Candidatus Omnitrophica bacterium]|nr:hypothetical protein [Candidatus Omnitrophota bacterium]
MTQLWYPYDPDGSVHENLGTRIPANLLALRASFAGTAEPASTVAFQLWADTTTGLLKRRNATNTAWVVIGPILGNGALSTFMVPLGDIVDADGDPIVFGAPSSAHIVDLGLVVSADALPDADDYWTFQIQNTTKTLDLLSAAITTETVGLTAYVPLHLTPDQNEDIDLDDVILLSISKTGSAPDLVSPRLFLSWYPTE